jgi:hypothetical protein
MIRINLQPASETVHPKRRIAVAVFVLILLLGSLSRATPFIATGTLATTTDFPAAVSLTMSAPASAGADGWDGSCTGFLVAPKLILTAAHCFENNSNVRAITNAPDIHNTKGSYNFKIGKSGSHPDYVIPSDNMTPKERAAAIRIDIGYVTLREEVPAAVIAPLPVFVTYDSPTMLSLQDLTATLVGYGATEWRSDGNYSFAKYGVKHFGDKLVTNVQLGYILMAGEKNGSLPGDSGGPIVAEIGGMPTAIALNQGMAPGKATVPDTDKAGVVKLDRKGKPKTKETVTYGDSIGTMLTRDNLCWVVNDSKIEIPGLDCTPAGAPK